MIVARWFCSAEFFAIACIAVCASPNVRAQPLVTGDLTIYYDFDAFTQTVIDGSGNGFNGKVRDKTRNMLDEGVELSTSGVISNHTAMPKRGAGAIRFTQSPILGDDPVFLDLDGSAIKANAPTKVPKEAITVAAWLNLPEVNATIGGQGNYNAPASIYQAASSGPSFVTHFHAEGNGTIRLALRGESQAQNIVNSGGAPFADHPYPNQAEIDSSGADPEPWPLNEWFHVAFTYDKNASGGAGEFAMYFNGVKIRSGAPNGQTSGVPTGPIDLGDWDLRAVGDFYDGLGIGAVMDTGGRRLHGLMDEFYIFSRALSDAEIGTLVTLAEPLPPLLGDYNRNGVVDIADYTVWRDQFGLLVEQGSGPDGNVNGFVDSFDRLIWHENYGNTSSAAGSAPIPEPTSASLAIIGLVAAMGARRRHV